MEIRRVAFRADAHAYVKAIKAMPSYSDRARQIELAFRLAASRPPTEKEQQIASQFLQTQSLREFCLALLNLNAFLYVE